MKHGDFTDIEANLAKATKRIAQLEHLLWGMRNVLDTQGWQGKWREDITKVLEQGERT